MRTISLNAIPKPRFIPLLQIRLNQLLSTLLRALRGKSVFFVLILLLGLSLRAATPTTRPNFLFISTEDICPDLHCYGDAYATTPNLDRFASQGIRFERAFSTAPVCSPSRASIITGMYAASIGAQYHRSDIIPAPDVRCFTEYLRQAGYYCTNNAKTDYNFPAPASAWNVNGKQAHWRNRPDKSQPFFAVFNIETTHEAPVMNLNGRFTHLLDSLPNKHDPALANIPSYYPDTPKVRANWARYNDCITLMDQQFQALLDQLDADGLTDNTVVCFWGDHGRCLPRGKRWDYDSGLHVPLLIRWPAGFPAGQVRPELVTLMDLGPTLLSLAGLDVPPQMQGRIILGPHTQPEPQYVFATRDREDETVDMQRTARDRQYRYIKNFHPELPYSQHNKYGDHNPIMQEWYRLDAAHELKGPDALFFAPTKPAEELYDESTDTDEIHNLAADPAQQERLVTMRTALENWMNQIHDKSLIPEDQMLAQMWPADHKRPVTSPVVFTTNGNTVTLSCPTPGSSILYTTDASHPTWHLYNPQSSLPPSPNLRAKACRIGFGDSEESKPN
ncbi:MAG TPA: sulfatase-like hydrolase/transferase [Tepidisphaeraceae bacterium]|jgi:uncharacterized sulfatase|nr:sulfatase-like hydrolase/transferase [Tepidisphaeraceae bacterium]